LNKVHTSYSSTIVHFNYLGTTDLLKDVRTNSKPEDNIKSLNYIQQNLKVFKPHFCSIELCLLLFHMISGLKVTKIGNDCATLSLSE